VSRLTQDLNGHQVDIPALTEDTEMEIMDGVSPVLATPAYALGAGAVLGAAGLGFAIEEVLGDG
jgi:hypothetical protein